MKSISIITIISAIITLLMVSFSPASYAIDKFHSYEQYRATYKLEGVKSGEKIFCSRNWGREKVQIENVSIKTPEETKKINQKIITRIVNGEKWIYGINLDKNEGSKVNDPKFPALLELMKDKDPADFAKSVLKKEGGEIIGQNKILGIDCDIWKISTIEICVSDKGIALQTKSEQPEITETITSIDTDSTCKPEMFSTGSASIKEIDL